MYFLSNSEKELQVPLKSDHKAAFALWKKPLNIHIFTVTKLHQGFAEIKHEGDC